MPRRNGNVVRTRERVEPDLLSPRDARWLNAKARRRRWSA